MLGATAAVTGKGVAGAGFSGGEFDFIGIRDNDPTFMGITKQNGKKAFTSRSYYGGQFGIGYYHEEDKVYRFNHFSDLINGPEIKPEVITKNQVSFFWLQMTSEKNLSTGATKTSLSLKAEFAMIYIMGVDASIEVPLITESFTPKK